MAISLFDMIRKAIYLDSTVMHELLSRCRRLLVGKHLSICFLWFILFRPSNKEPHKAFKKTNRCMLPFLPCLQINDSMPQLTPVIFHYTRRWKGGVLRSYVYGLTCQHLLRWATPTLWICVIPLSPRSLYNLFLQGSLSLLVLLSPHFGMRTEE
jgi:hypothetical protein